MSNKINNDLFIKKLHDINPNITPLEEYAGSRTKLYVKCNICNNEWYATPSNLTNKNPKGCPICGRDKAAKSRRRQYDTFVNEMKQINKNVKIIGKYKNALTPIECLCLIHNEFFNTSPSHLLKNEIGCQKCRSEKISNSLIKSSEKFIEEVSIKNSTVKVIGNYSGNHKKIEFECKNCGYHWNAEPASVLNGNGCPKCNMSHGEKYIRHFLDNHNIIYESQKVFPDLKGINNGLLSYDFYIESLNILIEFQGRQHEKPINIFGGEEYFNIQKEHDKRKREYAESHNINLLEIWYYEIDKIDDILKNYLILNPVEITA